MSGLRVASRGERECLDGRSSSSEQRHVGGLPNEQRPGTCVSGAVTLPAHQAWPVGAFMPRCGGSAADVSSCSEATFSMGSFTQSDVRNRARPWGDKALAFGTEPLRGGEGRVGTSPTPNLVQGGDDLSREAESSLSEAFRPVYEALCSYFANNPCVVVLFLRSFALHVPEIISSIRQAGKIARQEELRCPSEFDDTFAKKFEVLFCGRVAVAHRKAPPALIDECIEGFSHVSGGFSSDQFRSALQPPGDGERGPRPMRKSFSQPGLRSLAFRKEFQDAGLRSSSFFSSFEESDIENHLISGHNIVQPTDIEENRTMLFTGIRHVDHFGFICRESSGGGGFHFVCYVFQCTNEALVDEIMMTLKQAFTVAAVQQTAKAPAQLCEGCPLQGLHKLCERIEGMNSSKTKLELQKHLTTLTNQEQATIFEEVQKLRPRNEQRENELIISFLRCLYEEKQKVHIHIGEIKQTSQIAAESIGSELPSSATRFRLDMLKNKAKRSLTESLESILSRGNKARGLQEHSASLDLDSSVSSMFSNTSKEPSGCEKEALPISESCFRLLGSSDDLSSDSESQPTEEPALLSPKQGFRRRANTLSHVPVECQEPPQLVRGSPGVSQRKLVRYHSVSTETPHERNGNCPPVGESQSPSGQSSAPAPPPRLNPSASSPNFFKYLKHNPSGEQSGNAVPKSISYRNALRKKLHSSSSVPNFLKFLAPVDENNTSDFMNTQRDFESKADHISDASRTPVKTRRHSWRQQIFLRVATPQKACESPKRYEGPTLVPLCSGVGNNPSFWTGRTLLSPSRCLGGPESVLVYTRSSGEPQDKLGEETALWAA
ncbi:TBC1 domain family member 1 [Bos mutus]|uniref:TBC1 domain family member 1 n=1 Tax=Bos mutus TaxID=72004 RepID=L8ICH0_9CETA|nr:TBC1 domain family member 1 [Bos mutus]